MVVITHVLVLEIGPLKGLGYSDVPGSRTGPTGFLINTRQDLATDAENSPAATVLLSVIPRVTQLFILILFSCSFSFIKTFF